MSSPLFKPVEIRSEKGHRQATWLELFMDLAFVISIAALTTMLVNNLTPRSLVLYTGLFLAVYWVWNQLTWYASLFDNGDVFFRIMYMSAILTVLLAAGWIRVYINNHEFKSFSLRYILGQVIGSVVWLVSLGFPIPQQYYIWCVAMVIHIASPYVAWKNKTNIPIHLSHIIERYCLFTIIVLGETLVAVSVGVASNSGSKVFLTTVFGYIIVACIWWTYFNWDFNRPRKFKSTTQVFAFGYGHFVIFLTIAAFGAGLETVIHSAGHGGHLTLMGRLLVGFSPSIYLVSISVMNRISWDMAFDRKMVARISVAMLSLAFALLANHTPPVVFTGGIALLMFCLVSYEQICCATSQ
jgi:low temperature requirement protein LtrA